MKDTLLIFLGTNVCGIALDFQRELDALRTAIRRRLRIARDDDTKRQALEQQLEHLEQGVHVKAFDVDTAKVYEINPPLSEAAVRDFPLGTFHPCPMPGRDMIEGILDGRFPGRFETLNPDGIRALGTTTDGTGGMRHNGRVAAEHNQPANEQVVHACLEAIAQRWRLRAPTEEAKVRLILVASTFGGFGSGAEEEFRQLVLRVAKEVALPLDIVEILIVPGMTSPKDPDNSAAMTYAVLKDLSARSTTRHWHRERPQGALLAGPVPSFSVPTLILSDTNSSPGEPKALTVRNLNGMVAELLLAWVCTPLGGRLDSQRGDLQAATMQLTVRGEPLACLSAGVATVRLPRDWILCHATERLKVRVVSDALVPVDSAEVARDVRAFFESRRVVEGGGVHELADVLLERDGGHGLVDIERFREVFARNAQTLAGLALLREGATRFQLSVEQRGDLEEALRGRGQDRIDALRNELITHTGQLASDRRVGPAGAKQWAEEALAVLETMLVEAAKDTANYELEVERLRQRVDHFQTVYVPQVSRKGPLYRLLRGGRIEDSALEYRRSLEELEVARMRLAAHRRAVDVLSGLGEPLKQRLVELQRAIDTLAAERDRAAAEVERLAGLTPDSVCPVGLSLVRGREDLERYYERLLPQGSEERAATDVHTRLLQAGDLLAIAAEPERLGTALREAVEGTFLGGVEALHVVDELRSLCPRPEELGAVMKERGRESAPYIALKDSSAHEHDVRLIRLVGVDSGRAGNLLQVMSQYDQPSKKNFEEIDTGDPDRILLLQMRGGIPVSDWAHFDRARRVHERVWARLAFERYDTVPGERWLPVPGQLLTEPEARNVAFKAWVTGRLTWDPHRGWMLLPVDASGTPQELGKHLEVLQGKAGYGMAVDVISFFDCYYLANGPEAVRSGVQRLVAARAARAPGAVDPVERELAQLFDAGIEAEVERQLLWWDRNTVPVAMEWWSRPGRGLPAGATPLPAGAGARPEPETAAPQPLPLPVPLPAPPPGPNGPAPAPPATAGVA